MEAASADDESGSALEEGSGSDVYEAVHEDATVLAWEASLAATRASLCEQVRIISKCVAGFPLMSLRVSLLQFCCRYSPVKCSFTPVMLFDSSVSPRRIICVNDAIARAF